MDYSMDKLISVISPIYNAVEFLDKMFDSLENQTYSNWELILVNDFSSDNSEDIIKAKAKDDKRIKLINRDTKGGTAVKGIEYGLPFCSGDYFFFMSQDDFFDYDFLEKCLKKAEETDADVVIPNMYLYYGDHSDRLGHFPDNGDYDVVISGRDAFYESLGWNIHSNTFKRMNLTKSVGYKAEYYNSCEYYGRTVFLEAKKIVFCDANFYYRQNNSQAITKNFHYFQIDILTTDILLLEKLYQVKYDKEKVVCRLNDVKAEYKGWLKTALATPVNNVKERIYMIKAIIANGIKLKRLSKMIKVM